MIRLQLWQPPSFQRSLASHPWKYGLLKRSSLRDCRFRCRFSTSNCSLVPKSRKGVPALKSPKPLAKPIESVSHPSRKPATYEPLKEQLATRSSPTILYRASSYTHYITACYTSGIFFVGCAISNYGTKQYAQLQDVPAYVPVFITVGSLFLACFGFWMFLKPQNIVQKISSIPSVTSVTKLNARTLLLQIERVPLVPFTGPRITTVPNTDVTLSSTVFDNDKERRIEAEIRAIKHREDRLRAFAKTNIFTLPFRIAGYWMWRGFIGVRRAFTGEGFNYLHVRGRNRAWKLDKDPAYALDDGKALDRLVKVKLG